MNQGYLDKDIENLLTKEKFDSSTKVLIYENSGKLGFALQMYDEAYLNWYKEEMIKAVRDMKLKTTELPKEITLEELMNRNKVSELRLPTKLEDRCAGYVEAKLENNEVKYEAYVDCLTEATYFASHYVSYGGKYLDEFLDVKETSDGGYIAVGRSNSETITKYGTGNNGKYDAIIVKFNSKGEVEWSRNFGGSNDDVFYAVAEGPAGYVAVGQTASNDGDIEGYKGGSNDALIVAYDKQGNVTYKRSYGTDSISANHAEMFTNIIVDNNGYVIIGLIDGRNKDGDLEGETKVLSQYDGIILKLDLNFNPLWRQFLSGSYSEYFYRVIKDSDGNYIVIGSSSSKDMDMNGYGYETTNYQSEAIILKIKSTTGEILKIKSFKGSRSENFNDVIEVNDGYVVVGYTESNDYDVNGISKADNGYRDGLIIKYDKNFNLLWAKIFGGSNEDVFKSLVQHNNNEVIVVGYSKSNDIDMTGLSKTNVGYKNAILVKYNIENGELLEKRIFGGTNSDSFDRVIKTTNNQYVIAGSSYSSDLDLKNFNKGHCDAILVKYDKNLSLVKEFQEAVVIIDKIKKIETKYGTELKLKYDNIYTTNDPTIDLKNWCTTNEVYTVGNTSNYYYWCIGPFNNDDMKSLVEMETANGLKYYKGEREYLISKNMDDNRNWIRLSVTGGNSTGDLGFSKLKLKFADGYEGHLTDAVEKGYIEPLVIVNSHSSVIRPAYLLPNVIDIINENGDTGIGSYPHLRVLFKPKKSSFIGVKITCTKDSGNHDGLILYELRNFDMSIEPTN